MNEDGRRAVKQYPGLGGDEKKQRLHGTDSRCAGWWSLLLQPYQRVYEKAEEGGCVSYWQIKLVNKAAKAYCLRSGEEEVNSRCE